MRLFLGSSIPATRAIERSSRYPWRCLWRGLEHRMRTTPSRRTTLQFLQIFLTEALTFMVQSLAHSIRDPAAGQLVGRQFHRDLVAGQNFYVVHPHFARNMGQ